MKSCFLLLLLSGPLFAVFLNPEANATIWPGDHGAAPDGDMSQGQKTLSLQNFNSLGADDLDALELRDPILATPGDVLGVGFLPKTNHLLGRTPNLRFEQEELEAPSPIFERVEIMRQPVVSPVLPAADYIDQPFFENYNVNIQAPDVTLPSFNLLDKDCIKLPEAADFNLPQMTMPGEINAALPQVNVAAIDAEMPQIALKDQQVVMPEVNVARIDTVLPEVNVRDIELAAFPDINVPEFNAALPNIALPEAQAVIMPKVAVPQIDDRMPEVNLPQQVHMNLPDLSVPDIGTELPNLKVENAFHDNLPEINLAGITANIPENRIEDAINVTVPRISIPDLLVAQAPQKFQANIREIVPDIFTEAGLVGADDIATQERAAVVIPQMNGFNVQAPNIADLWMKSRTAIAPRIDIPQIRIRAPSVQARGSLAGNFGIRPQMIPFPKVNVAAPRIDFQNVNISKIPKFCIVKEDVNCPKWIVPVPPINRQYKMVQREVIIPAPKTNIGYVMVPREFAEKNNIAFRELNDKIKINRAQKRIVSEKVWVAADKGIYRRSELPNEVAGAYGIKRHDGLDKLQADLKPRYMVGQGLH